MTNGVQTGFDGAQPYGFIDNIASGWSEKERLDVLLLRAICQLSAEAPEQAKEGYTSPEILESISRIRGRPWSSSDDKGQMSADVRRQWSSLLKTWQSKQEGIEQRFGDHGYSVVPRLDKTEGGGSGHLSRYRIEWQPTATATTDSSPTSAAAHDLPIGWVRYVCEDIDDAGVVSRIFAKGYVLAGWRRWLFTMLLTAPLLFVFILFIYALFGVTFWSAFGTKIAIDSVISFVVIYFATFLTIGPILSLPTDKIVVAPWWLQSNIVRSATGASHSTTLP